MRNSENRKELIISAFNQLNKNNLDVLDSFYDAHTYENVINFKFDFLDIQNSENMFYAKWNMHLQAKNLNKKKSFVVEGFSVLKFGARNFRSLARLCVK